MSGNDDMNRTLGGTSINSLVRTIFTKQIRQRKTSKSHLLNGGKNKLITNSQKQREL